VPGRSARGRCAAPLVAFLGPRGLCAVPGAHPGDPAFAGAGEGSGPFRSGLDGGRACAGSITRRRCGPEGHDLEPVTVAAGPVALARHAAGGGERRRHPGQIRSGATTRGRQARPEARGIAGRGAEPHRLAGRLRRVPACVIATPNCTPTLRVCWRHESPGTAPSCVPVAPALAAGVRPRRKGRPVLGAVAGFFPVVGRGADRGAGPGAAGWVPAGQPWCRTGDALGFVLRGLAPGRCPVRG